VLKKLVAGARFGATQEVSCALAMPANCSRTRPQRSAAYRPRAPRGIRSRRETCKWTKGRVAGVAGAVGAIAPPRFGHDKKRRPSLLFMRVGYVVGDRPHTRANDEITVTRTVRDLAGGRQNEPSCNEMHPPASECHRLSQCASFGSNILRLPARRAARLSHFGHSPFRRAARSSKLP
jgi:hypothetical protein